jgi:stage II sporulation protein D
VARYVTVASAAAVVFGFACASAVSPLTPRPAAGDASRSPASPAPVPAAVPSARSPTGTIGSSGLTPHLSDASDVVVRVAVGWRLPEASFSGRAAWTLEYAGGGGSIARAAPGEMWSIEAVGSLLRVGRGGSPSGPPRGTTVVLRPVSHDDAVLFAGKRYRGELRVSPTDTGLLVINRVGVEDYLRAVVPLEIGNRPPADMAAAEAQAITARSYVYVRIRSRRTAQYDIVSDVRGQVYGGVEAERPTTDAAIVSTGGLGLFYNGELVDAPYHSTCGGATAGATEVWRTPADVPYLRPVSDRIPGSDRFWCDSSATFRWSRTFARGELNTVIARYLRQYVTGAPAEPGAVRELIEGPRTSSGRLRSLTVVTARGRYVLRGNDMRFVLRGANDHILNSTSFSVAQDRTSGELRSVTLRGSGNGHGVGMCQWGAIGRARAGQTARQILAAYYVGTTVEPVNTADLRSSR